MPVVAAGFLLHAGRLLRPQPGARRAAAGAARERALLRVSDLSGRSVRRSPQCSRVVARRARHLIVRRDQAPSSGTLPNLAIARSDDAGRRFVDFFQMDRDPGREKGIIALDLESMT